MAEKRRRSGTCYCIQLRRAASRVTEQYDAALAPVGLTVGQYSLLAHLERLEPGQCQCAGRRDGVGANDPGAHAQACAGSALGDGCGRTRAAQPGIDTDRGGAEPLEQARPLWRAAQADVEHRLGEDGVAALEALLDQLEF